MNEEWVYLDIVQIAGNPLTTSGKKRNEVVEDRVSGISDVQNVER